MFGPIGFKASEINKFLEENGSAHRVVAGQPVTLKDYTEVHEAMLRKVLSEREGK